MLSAPFRSAAIGFSANTGLPSSRALSAIAGCRAGSVAMATASTLGCSTNCCQSPNARGMPAADASSAVRATSRPASATTSQRASSRKAGRWTRRPKLQPTMPMRTNLGSGFKMAGTFRPPSSQYDEGSQLGKQQCAEMQLRDKIARFDHLDELSRGHQADADSRLRHEIGDTLAGLEKEGMNAVAEPAAA